MGADRGGMSMTRRIPYCKRLAQALRYRRRYTTTPRL